MDDSLSFIAFSLSLFLSFTHTANMYTQCRSNILEAFPLVSFPSFFIDNSDIF